METETKQRVPGPGSRFKSSRPSKNGRETAIGTITDKQRPKLSILLFENKIFVDDFEKELGFGISQLSTSEASQLIGCLSNDPSKLGETLKDVKKQHSFHVEGKMDEFFNQPTQQLPSSHKLPMTVGKISDRVHLMAALQGIPAELANMYFMIFNGDQLYIKIPGLLHIAKKQGYARIDTDVTEVGDEWRGTAHIYPTISVEVLQALHGLPEAVIMHVLMTQYGPTTVHATASKSNVLNSRMHARLMEFAETRATARALRLYTGYGGTSYEELPDAEIEVE